MGSFADSTRGGKAFYDVVATEYAKATERNFETSSEKEKEDMRKVISDVIEAMNVHNYTVVLGIPYVEVDKTFIVFVVDQLIATVWEDENPPLERLVFVQLVVQKVAQSIGKAGFAIVSRGGNAAIPRRG